MDTAVLFTHFIRVVDALASISSESGDDLDISERAFALALFESKRSVIHEPWGRSKPQQILFAAAMTYWLSKIGPIGRAEQNSNAFIYINDLTAVVFGLDVAGVDFVSLGTEFRRDILYLMSRGAMSYHTLALLYQVLVDWKHDKKQIQDQRLLAIRALGGDHAI